MLSKHFNYGLIYVSKTFFLGCIRFLLEVQVQLYMSAHWLQQQWIWKSWGPLHIRLLSVQGLGSLRYCELWADSVSVLIYSSHRFSSFWGKRTINSLFFIATIIAECFSWLIVHQNGFLVVREFVSALLTTLFIVWCTHTISWPPSSPSSRSQCGGRSTLPNFKLRSFAFCPSYFQGPCYQTIATTLSWLRSSWFAKISACWHCSVIFTIEDMLQRSLNCSDFVQLRNRPTCEKEW